MLPKGPAPGLGNICHSHPSLCVIPTHVQAADPGILVHFPAHTELFAFCFLAKTVLSPVLLQLLLCQARATPSLLSPRGSSSAPRLAKGSLSINDNDSRARKAGASF